MTASVWVQFGADGAAQVRSYVRLTASTYVHCCTYDDAAPILTIDDGAADITITNPGRGEVTEQDVRFGRLLAQAVARYAAELERLVSAGDSNPAPPDGTRACTCTDPDCPDPVHQTPGGAAGRAA